MNFYKCLRLVSVFVGGMSIGAVIASAEMADVSSPDFRIVPVFGTPTQTNNGPATTKTEVVSEQGQAPMLQENSAALMQAAEPPAPQLPSPPPIGARALPCPDSRETRFRVARALQACRARWRLCTRACVPAQVRHRSPRVPGPSAPGAIH